MSSMLQRHWDPSGRFAAAHLRWYQHWSLELSWQQHTLGCFIIFCRRQGVRIISQLSPEELEELAKVMGDMESALCAIPEIRPDHFNYLQMGNALPLLHFHGIPRYQTDRSWQGEAYRDLTWGHPPVWSKTAASEEMVMHLKEMVLSLLPPASL